VVNDSSLKLCPSQGIYLKMESVDVARRVLLGADMAVSTVIGVVLCDINCRMGINVSGSQI